VIYGEQYGLRHDTELPTTKTHVIFNQGGMGDFVNYTAATTWLAKNAPWFKPRLFVPNYLKVLLRDIHAEFPDWRVHKSEDFKLHFKSGDAFIGAGITIGGLNITPQFLTATGAHPIDVGFAYYAGMTPPPPDGLLPVLDYPEDQLPFKLQGKRYVVLPVGNNHAARAVYGRHLNPIIEYVRDKGLLPVFLGKRDMLGNGEAFTKFADDVNYSEGLDLRDKTNVKEAACILQHAMCTVGLDTGLLHLAALMKDSRIVFGYNITTVAHREPRRNHGRHVNVTLTQGELKCVGCQSRLRQIEFQFDKCIHGDAICIDLLFANQSAKWKSAIDEVLNG